MRRTVRWAALALVGTLLAGAGVTLGRQMPTDSSVGFGVAITPVEGEGGAWQVRFRAYDLESRRLLAEPVVEARPGDPATLRMRIPPNGANVVVAVAIDE